MYKLSELISLPVVSIFEGNTIGVVKNIVLNNKMDKLKYLVIFNDDDIVEHDKILDAKKIYSIGSDSILIKNENHIDISKSFNDELNDNNPINAKIFDCKGNIVNRVKDIEFDESFFIKNIILNDLNTLKTSDFINRSKSVFILKEKPSDNKSKFAIRNKKPQKEDNQIVQILKSDNAIINDKLMINSEKEYKETPNLKININNISAIPIKVISQLDFLLERKSIKNIYSSNNELIIKKDGIITQHVISLAQKYNKVKDLAIFSQI